MERKFNVSQPTVINTELRQLDESFYISADGQTEQWFYDNTAQYAPNRALTPLTLTPVLSLYDGDTKTTYNNPSFNQIKWYALEYDESNEGYIETQITNITDSSEASYVIVGNTLKVKKNTPYTRSITIRCVAEYIDPRDSGITNTVQEIVLLTTNRDATVVFPEVAIISPSGRSFNPLTDYKTVNGVEVQASEYEFEGTITNQPDVDFDPTDGVAKYKCDGGGTEELVTADGGLTAAPIMDIRYPDGTTEVGAQFVSRLTADGEKLNMEGNASIEAIKGNTVKWNQLCSNGDFSNGTSGWKPNSTVSSISSYNGVMEITKSSSNVNGSASYDYSYTPDHIYYACATVRPSVDTERTRLCFTTRDIVSTALEANVWVKLRGIKSDDTGRLRIYVDSTTNTPAGTFLEVMNAQIIDLTFIFGTNAQIAAALGIDESDITNDTGVAAFESWMEKNLGKKEYYPYEAGSLVPVTTSAINTVSFNIFDDSVYRYKKRYLKQDGTLTSASNFNVSGYIPIQPNTEYYINKVHGSAPSVGFYDKNKTFISGIRHDSSSGVTLSFTTPYNAYYLCESVEIDENQKCINISSSRNGQYSPHWSNTAPLDITAIKGRLVADGDVADESTFVFPDGMKRIGSVYDEIKLENGVLKAIRRVKAVDMGTLSYNTYNTFTWPSNVPKVNTNRTAYVVIPFYTPNGSAYASMPDLTYGGSGGANSVCFLKDERYTSGSEKKAAMSGIIAYFVLETPEEYVLDPVQSPFVFEWFGISNNTEVKADTLPWYVSGQNTPKLKVDAMFGENINVVLRAKMPNGELSPSKAHAAVTWRIPDVDTHVVCQNGSAVRSDTLSMTFKTICNVNGGNIDDNVKDTHMRFNWKTRKNTVTTETDNGWGSTKTIAATNLRNTRGVTSSLASTLVYPYVYVLGAWKVKTSTTVVDYDKPEITKDGVIYERTID